MKKALILAVTALSISTAAFAMDHSSSHKTDKMERMKKMMHHKMEKIDTNKDGMISKAEMLAAAEKKFDESDADNDGLLTKEEMKAAKKKKHAKHHDKKKDEAAKDNSDEGDTSKE